MARYRRFFSRIAGLFRRGRAEREMAREMAAHLALIEEDYRRRGLTPGEALLAARRAYGGVERAKDLHRDARGFVWLEQWMQDVRHAARSLRKSPVFTAVAVLSLALGIGMNTAIFTLVNGVLLKTLPVPDPQRVVELRGKLPEFTASGFNYPIYREMRRQRAIFSDVIGSHERQAVLDLGGTPRTVDFALVTGSFFSFFHARPALGRLLDEEDDATERGHRVCVISYEAWQSLYGGDPRVLHRTIAIDGVPLEVVGVAPARFVGAELQRRADVWASTSPFIDFGGNSRDSGYLVWLGILGRLQPGLSLAEASSRLQSASRAIEDALPAQRTNKGAIYQLVDASRGFDTWRTTLRDPLLILMGAVSLVLLVACANLANLLLARASERQREFAIKLSLGIDRWRLLRQLLVETFGLALSGAAAGVLVSLALTELLLGLFNAGQRFQTLHVAPDASVLLFTFGACVLTTVIAGLYPAWQASRVEANSDLKGGAFLLGLHRSRARRALILAQIMLTVVLLFGASLFAHSLGKLRTISLGYDIDHVLTVQIGQRGPYKPVQPAGRPALLDVLDRVRALPGVEDAAWSNPGVLTGGMFAGQVTPRDASGAVLPRGDAYFLSAGTHYFSTMRIPLLRGRDFTEADRRARPPVALVNQRFAAQFWPGQNPIGKHFNDREVIGVVGNSKYADVREETRLIGYFADPLRDGALSLEIRCRAGFGPVERQVRDLVKSMAPDYEVSHVASMELLRDTVMAQDRLLTFLSALFGFLGVALALVGIYGLISYSVTRRTREIGIRMSLGAQPGNVLWLFLREILMLIAAGMLLGLPLALRLARFLEKMLYQVSPSDPLGIAATLVLLTLGGLAAAWLPGRRATRVDPVQALRYD